MPVEILICPNCGAPLERVREITRCPFCGSTLHLILDGVQTCPGGTPGEAVVTAPAPPEPLSAEEAARMAETIGSLVRQGKDIEAIKLYRRRTGEGILASKQAVEALGLDPSAPEPLEKLRVGSKPLELSFSLRGEVPLDILRELLAEGKKNEAIQLYQERSGVGQDEARDAVEAIASGSSPPKPSAPPASPEESPADRARELLRLGRKDEAIQVYQAGTGVSPADAKAIIAAIDASLHPGRRGLLNKPVWLLVLVLVAAIVGVMAGYALLSYLAAR